MDDPYQPTAHGRAIAYAISMLGTLLWAGCVLPAGQIAAGLLEDLSTPLGREAWLLVPALLLLIVGPVGVILSRTRVGLAAVLAATDAFVAFYMATALTLWGAFRGTCLRGAGRLAVTSSAPCRRSRWCACCGGDPTPRLTPYLRGLRLALCLLALLTPSWILVQGGRELASLLVPYAIIAVGAGGAAMARTELGLRLTSAILILAFAAHVLVVLRYTIFDRTSAGRPAIHEITAFGWFTLGISVLMLLLASVQVVRLARRVLRLSAEAGARRRRRHVERGRRGASARRRRRGACGCVSCCWSSCSARGSCAGRPRRRRSASRCRRGRTGPGPWRRSRCWRSVGSGATALAARARDAASRSAPRSPTPVVATAATLLVAGEHPWFPGGDARANWIPVFAPLAALAGLHAVVLAMRADTAREVAVIRAVAALLAAGALVVGQAWLPAAIALWLGAAPLLVDRMRDPRTALEVLFLAASVVALTRRRRCTIVCCPATRTTARTRAPSSGSWRASC